MSLHSEDRLRGRGWAIPLAFALAFACTSVCSAQMTGGGGGGDGGRGGGPRDPGSDNPADGRKTGSVSGWIMKYKPPKEGDPEDILAYMTVKPQEGRPVKIIVLRDEPVSIELGERKDFAPEEYADVLTKGIYCNCSWKETERKKDPSDKKGKMYNVLSRVGFDNFEVTGKIEEISEDMVVIKGKPVNDRPWPDTPPKKANPKRGGTEQAPKVFSKKLKLRIFEDATTFKDSVNHVLDISDFEPKQTVTAMVVYGRRGGIILELKSPTQKEGAEDDSENKGGRGGGRPGL